ncbi:hypothetical protein BT69DRAFT_1281863 [Atractiella rhizophila]|nr:hypothetical protein BT69DRAFT_1281863 [Atractiella rhizophila]
MELSLDDPTSSALRNRHLNSALKSGQLSGGHTAPPSTSVEYNDYSPLLTAA